MTTSTCEPVILDCPRCLGDGANLSGYWPCDGCGGTGCLITTHHLCTEMR